MVVKAEKKLLTVLFPDGRDGRAFTLKVIFHFSCFVAVSFDISFACIFAYFSRIISPGNKELSLRVLAWSELDLGCDLAKKFKLSSLVSSLFCI